MRLEKLTSAMIKDGRFVSLLDLLDLQEECFTTCPIGNPFILAASRKIPPCAIYGKCIGLTLNTDLIIIMLHAAELVTSKQIRQYYGP